MLLWPIPDGIPSPAWNYSPVRPMEPALPVTGIKGLARVMVRFIRKRKAMQKLVFELFPAILLLALAGSAAAEDTPKMKKFLTKPLV